MLRELTVGGDRKTTEWNFPRGLHAALLAGCSVIALTAGLAGPAWAGSGGDGGAIYSVLSADLPMMPEVPGGSGGNENAVNGSDGFSQSMGDYIIDSGSGGGGFYGGAAGVGGALSIGGFTAPGYGGDAGAYGTSSLSINSGDSTGVSGSNGGDGDANAQDTNLFLGGGGGGAGGAALYANGISIENDGTLTGGTGGNGGSGAYYDTGPQDGIIYYGGGGGGGDGGDGMETQSAEAILNVGTITGGDGGNGGAGGGTDGTYAFGGDGGNGGAGMAVELGNAFIFNTGTISGGNGGSSGGDGAVDGVGGVGIYASGANVTITNSGTISGGWDAGHINQADAIHFTSGTNKLILEAGSVINGVVEADGSMDTLTLGGDDLNNSPSFNLSAIGTQYLGFEAYEKTGASTWTLVGTAAPDVVTNWNVDDGVLIIGHGATVPGAVAVSDSGTLAGFGTIAGDVTNYGTVMTGVPYLDALGTLTVQGSYTQYAGGNLSMLVTPTGNSQLSVTGAANLDGTLKVVYAPGVYEAGSSYTVLTAQQGINGTFSAVSSEQPAKVSYGQTEVDLQLVEEKVVSPTNDTVFGSTGTSQIGDGQASGGALLDYLNVLHDGENGGQSAALDRPIRVAVASEDALWGLLAPVTQYYTWVRTIGRLSSLEGKNGAGGSDTKSGGVMAGIDKPFTDAITAGVSLGYDLTYVDEAGDATAHVSTPRLALYGSYAMDAYTLSGVLGYAHGFIDSRRPISATGDVAKGSYGSNEVSAALQGSYRFKVDGTTITPKTGVQYVHLSEQGFTEDGAPGFNLSVAGRDANSLRPFVGVGVARNFVSPQGVSFTPRADLEYSRETMNDAPSSTVSVGGGTFIVDGLKPSRDRFTLGAGIDAATSSSLTVHAGYNATLPTGNLFSQSFDVGVSYKF